MIKLMDHKDDIHSIFKIDKEIIYISKSQVIHSKTLKKIDISIIGNIKKNRRMLANIKEKSIDFYNSNLDQINVFNCDEINLESGLDIFSEEYFVIHNFVESDNLLIIKNGKIIKRINNFWGKVLNADYLIHFEENVFDDPNSFRLSDLLDNQTYFEYKCNEGEYVCSRFYVWNNYLIFVSTNDNKAVLIKLEIKTGNLVSKVIIQNGEFNFDEEKGMLISIWGQNNINNEQTKKYQKIDLNINFAEITEIISLEKFYNVNVHYQQQYLHNNKLFFSDNRLSYTNDQNPVRFGCFDIETKNIDYMQDIPESSISYISQIIYNDKKLYIRNANNNLFVFELD